MRLPDVSPFASPAADLLSRPSPRCGRQLHALTGQPAGPRWPQAAAVALVLLALMLLTGCAAVPERLEPLMEPRSPLQIARGDAVSSTRPLRRKIAGYLNDDVLAEIAAEGRKGRSLLVGTTNLDAGRPVVWDITRLAASDSPNAPALIHDVILTSASIPGVFPPVLIEVEANGEPYDELHVDGGVTAQLFFWSAGADWQRIAERLDAWGEPRLYVIRNAKLRPHWRIVKRRLVPIMSRSIDTLIGTQSIGNLAELYIVAREQGLDYRFAYIPQSFYAVADEPFDQDYMNKLFRLGHRRAVADDAWLTLDELD